MQVRSTLPAFRKLAAASAAALLLASCGGGDPYAGLWAGDMSSQRQVNAMVLGDGGYYMLYSQPGNPSVLAGLIHGTGDFHGGKVSSPDARDYNWETPRFPPLPGQATTVSARVSPRQSVAGTAGGKAFTVRHARDFEDDARIADIVGSHAGTVVFALGPRPATFVVTASGQVSTVINGCLITGTAQPRRDTNAFDIVMTFGGFPCVFPGASFSGIAFYQQDIKRLHAAVVNAGAQQAIGFSGTKQ